MTTNADVSWRDYVDTRFKSVDEKFVAKEKVDEQTAEALKSRLESMNEFRAQINAERGSYVTKDVLEATIRPMHVKQSMEAGAMWVIGAIDGMIGAAVPVVLYFLTKGK